MAKKLKNKIIIVSLITLIELIYISYYFFEPLFNPNGSSNIHFLILTVVFLILQTLAYIKLVRFYDILSPQIIVISIVIFSLTNFFVPTFASVDLNVHIGRSRIVSIYRENPYVKTYSEFTEDKFSANIKSPWISSLPVYPPVIFHIGSILTYLGNSSFTITYYLFKTIFLCSYLLTSYLIFKITNSYKSLIFFSLNPLILFELVLHAHVDSLMILFIMIGINYFTYKKLNKNMIKGWVFLLISIFTKYFTVVSVPFVAAYLLHKDKKFKLSIPFITMAITILVFYPFYNSIEIFSRIQQVSKISSFQASPFVFLTSLLLSTSGIPTQLAIKYSGLAGKILFLLSYTGLVIYTWEKIKDLKTVIFYSAVSISLFLGLFLNWFMPWYVTVLIAILSLYAGYEKNNSKINTIIYGVTFYGIINYLILG